MLKHWKRTLALLGTVAATGLVCAAVALGAKKPPTPPPPQPTVSYSITFLGVDGEAMDVNSLGEVVGYAAIEGVSCAFLVVPQDVDGDGDLEWYSDTDGNGVNYLMVLLNDLIDPDSGWDLRYAYAINDTGQIVGRGYLNGQWRGYRFTPGVNGAWAVVDDLETLEGAANSGAMGINDSGDVVGSSPWGSLYSRGFLWTEEYRMVDIGSLVEGGRTEARGITNSGGVTGFSYINVTTPRAFLYTPGVGMKDLGYFAPTRKNQTWESLGLDINDNNHVAGWAGVHAFVYTDHMIDLGTLGGYRSEAYGLNFGDEVVGLSELSTPDTTLHGFLYTNKTDTGGFVTFKLQDRIVNLPGDLQGGILPRRINDQGVICGSTGFATWTGREGTEAIVLTPLP
jgi:probable HAF family extracellular repeat protein